MKHVKSVSAQRPQVAQVTTGAIISALSQILQVVGAMLIEKQELNPDPYDY